MQMDVGPLFGLWFCSRSLSASPCGRCISGIVIFVIVYGRMIEIYLVTVGLAPIPMATMRATTMRSGMGQNYLRMPVCTGLPGVF